MKFVGIEYDVANTSNHIKGYLKIPDDFPVKWHLGFIEYLKEEKNAKGDIIIYPLNLKMDSDTIGKNILDYENLANYFILAVRSNKYYPICDETSAIRRAWSKLDPTTFYYVPRNRASY